MRWRVPESNRRVLITGAAGFLGEATLDRLTSSDPSLLAVCVDRRQTEGPPGETRRFISLVHDVTQPFDEILAANSIDTVIHLAFVMQPQRDPTLAHRVNVEATKNLLASCAKANVQQFIYLSSATVYGAHPETSHPFTEGDSPNPVKGFTYSEHKEEAERLVLAHGEANPDCAVSILRGCVVMGPGANNFITESLGLKFLPVPLGANPEMQFLHVDDYVSAIETILTQRSRGVFNIAGSGTVRWREMISIAGANAVPAPTFLLKAAVNLSWKLKLQQRSSTPGLNFIRYPWLVSTDKIESETGWKPEYSSKEALESWANARK